MIVASGSVEPQARPSSAAPLFSLCQIFVTAPSPDSVIN